MKSVVDARPQSCHPVPATPGIARRPALSIGLVAIRVGVEAGPGPARHGEERSIMPEPRIVLSGLGIPESPRWHEGRLWFCNWIDRQVMAADLDGKAEVMLTPHPPTHPLGDSIDWLPHGRLLPTGGNVRGPEAHGPGAAHPPAPAHQDS